MDSASPDIMIFYDNLLSNPKNVKTINSARKLTREELRRAKYKNNESSISKKLNSMSVCQSDINMFNNNDSVHNMNIFSLHDSNIYRDGSCATKTTK